MLTSLKYFVILALLINKSLNEKAAGRFLFIRATAAPTPVWHIRKPPVQLR